jgi:DNA-binding NtrC family response regulator
MLIENSNSDVLVLVRPADSVCAILSAALRQWGFVFTIYSTAYEVVNAAKDIPADRSAVLIVRPAMLGLQVALFIERHFPNLHIIGWIDAGENVSDCAIAQTTVNGMITASHLDQLQQIIRRRCETRKPSNRPEEFGALEYELSDDEVNALLGVV